MPKMTERAAGQLSIDDILLSMSDQGKRVTDAVLGAAEESEKADSTDAAEMAEKAGQTLTQSRAEGTGYSGDRIR